MTDRPSEDSIARTRKPRKGQRWPDTEPPEKLLAALRAAHGVHARAAEMLGVSRVRVTQLVGQYGLRGLCDRLGAEHTLATLAAGEGEQ